MSKTIQILINGDPITCSPGIPLSQVLTQHYTSWRKSPRLHQPRGMYCGMGVCFECMVIVNGTLRRSCLTDCADGMTVIIERTSDDG
ncbi:(2Fe-2S)-binding protein [Roseovarius sp. ZX-A-9]|uniref:(2Fe-2S)-binding protein n=1 Tax=Roseovarius sp. ZX-A-9 TaxID=3014783 RepID=UPI00232D4172|nr:(2Fe-2S)-binding protein [Roseovarius sp. ZX-A-9]